MLEPLKSTQLIVVRDQWQPPVPEGGKNPNLHRSDHLAHQNDRLENAYQTSGLGRSKSDVSSHQNCQLNAVVRLRQRRQVTVKDNHLAEECDVRRL